MTNPTITYGHGKLYDGDTVADFSETEDGNTGTFATYLDDWIKLTISASAGNKVYYIINGTNIQAPLVTYKKVLFRYMTSGAINAKIVIQDEDGDSQVVLAETSSLIPDVVAADITLDGDYLDHVGFYANGDSTGANYAMFDFFLVHEGTFTFPATPGSVAKVSLDMANNIPKLGIPSRIGSIKQYLGGQDTVIHVNGGIDNSTSWHGSNTDDLGRLYQIHHEMFNDPWQWFTSDLIKCKVTSDNLHVEESSESKNLADYDWELSEYRLSSGSNENYYWRFKGVGP